MGPTSVTRGGCLRGQPSHLAERATFRLRHADQGEETVAVGKRADLVLLASNPLDDIQNAGRIAGVLLGGQWLPRPQLDTRLQAATAAWEAARDRGNSAASAEDDPTSP